MDAEAEHRRRGQPMTGEDVVDGPLQADSPLRTPRAAAVAGIVFSVFLIAALVLLRLSVPADPRVAGNRESEQHERSEEHTSELQSPDHLVCRLLLEKKN